MLMTIIVVTAESQHWIGVRGGYNVSDISIDKLNDRKTESHSSINYGIIYKGYITNYMGIQSELNFIERGYTNKDNDTTHIVQSVEVPFFGHGRFEIGPFFVFANAGVYVGYARKKKQEVDDGNSTTTLSVKFTNRDKRFEFGAGIGGGIGFRIANRIEIQAEFRYNHSLTYLIKPKYHNARTTYIRPTSMQGSIGILYRLTNKQLKSKSYINL